MSELRDCGHCGGEARKLYQRSYGLPTIQCGKCNSSISGELVNYSDVDLEKLEKAWNTRTSDKLNAEVLELLEEMVENSDRQQELNIPRSEEGQIIYDKLKATIAKIKEINLIKVKK